jgi:hypothetical protein
MPGGTGNDLLLEQGIRSFWKEATKELLSVKGAAAPLLGGVFLTALYTWRYLRFHARPGIDAQYPLGWWGWWDQSNFLTSTVALAHFDLSPAQHHYPLGYAMLGAPFVRIAPAHPFFAVDLIALLVAMAAFVSFARRCGLARNWGTLVFVLAAAGDWALFQNWVVPWNTSPLAAAMWLLLAAAAAYIDGERRPILLGLTSVSIAMLRPSDMVLALPALAACLWSDVHGGRLRPAMLVRFCIAGFAGAVPYLGLHLLIYGAHPSDYMRKAIGIGFTLHHFGWKAYVILVDPRAWVDGGAGLLRRCPWMVLGIAGLLPALLRPKTAMLAATLVLHGILYISYVDLLPTSLWRYLNVHYWIWAFPGFALLGVTLLRILLNQNDTGRGERRVAVAGVLLAAALLCIRFDPVPAQAGQPIDALDFRVPRPRFDTVYFGKLTVIDGTGTLQNITQIRGIPMPDGVRVLALTRALRSPIIVQGQGLDAVPPLRLHARVGLGVPFWPWTKTAAFYGPQ